MNTLYDEDFYSWTQRQAAILRNAAELRLNAPEGIDWLNLAEEIDTLAVSLERELYSRYKALLAHLLKWRYQPGLRGSSWRRTIDDQRDEVGRLLLKNPGMKPKRLAEFEASYPKALRQAADETGLPPGLFPAACPFSIEQAEDETFWPEPAELVEACNNPP
jgi:hypothetical protein